MPVDLSTTACPLCGHFQLRLDRDTKSLVCGYVNVLTRPGVSESDGFALADARARRSSADSGGLEQLEEKCGWTLNVG